MKGTTHRRLNITLPESTVELMESVSKKGERSNLINIAVRTYIKQTKQKLMREQLKAGAIERGRRDLDLAKDWFDVEEELWRR